MAGCFFWRCSGHKKSPTLVAQREAACTQRLHTRKDYNMDELSKQAKSNAVPMVALNEGFKTIADALADIQFGFAKLSAEINENGDVTFTYMTQYGETLRFEVEE